MKKHFKIIFIITLIINVCSFKLFAQNKEFNLFVSPSGNDANQGTINSPFLTVAKAKAYVKNLLRNNTYSTITVNLRDGVFTLNEPLTFTKEDGGGNNCIVQYKAYQTENPVISGGAALPRKWVLADQSKNIWKLDVPRNIGGDINQLFSEGQRLIRSRSPMLYTAGPITQYARISGWVKQPTRFTATQQLKSKELLAFCSFAYSGNDLDNVDISNAEILLYHSWDCTWHSVGRVDKSNKSVYLKSPDVYPVGFFSNTNRYYVENSRTFLNSPGDWYFDKKAHELWYVANGNEDPNAKHFVVPQLDKLIVMQAEANADPIQNIKFIGIDFQYTNAPRGINKESKLAAKATDVPWLDLSTGFSGSQTAVECGESITLVNARNISFDRCTFTFLGTYAIRIGEYSQNIKVLNSEFSDLGGGGVLIGYNNRNPIAAHIPIEVSPSNNLIGNCKFHDLAIVYKSSVAVSIMQSHHNTIMSNEIYNLPYTGISCGWTWGFMDNYTSSNTITKNNIHDVMKELADGGGIYTLGPQQNSVIKNNYISNISRSKDAVGSRNNGIFFDQGSSLMKVDSNVIRSVQNEDIRFNQTAADKVDIEKNYFEKTPQNNSLINVVKGQVGNKKVN